MNTDEYEAISEAEWKVLATTEITHLTDEEKDYLPSAWDEWLARVCRDAAREALNGLARQEEEAFLHLHVNDAPISAAAAQYARSAAEAYKHEHYPTPEEAP